MICHLSIQRFKIIFCPEEHFNSFSDWREPTGKYGVKRVASQ